MTRPGFFCVATTLAALSSACASAPPSGDALVAAGSVFHDRNGDGVRSWLEPGVAGVVVSNGRDVVVTDDRGRYRIAVDADTIIFVAKPAGWAVPVDGRQIPRFYYIHKPAGSPDGLAFPGVPPTGPLPSPLDFPLVRAHEPDAFEAIVFGDTQPYRLEEIEFLERDVIAELVGSDAAFGITLGDLVGDDLSLFDPLSDAIARIGVPWYQVFGNHDLNYRAADDEHSDESFEQSYGPATYAFAYARVHFIVLDDVVYVGAAKASEPGFPYRGGLSDDQLHFVEQYLETVPRDRLVVLAMHIPFDYRPFGVAEYPELLALLGDRPHTLSLVSHMHFQESHFFGPEQGFAGAAPHHQLIAGTPSGSWWLGPPDAEGIPVATMRDGTPNGYLILAFEGAEYTIRFKGAREPADHQLRVSVPGTIRRDRLGEAEVIVNVFAGSTRTRVEMRIDETGRWTPLRFEPREDPHYLETIAADLARDPRPRRYLPPAIASRHIWVGGLPRSLPTGRHALTVRATDVYGQVFEQRVSIRVE